MANAASIAAVTDSAVRSHVQKGVRSADVAFAVSQFGVSLSALWVAFALKVACGETECVVEAVVRRIRRSGSVEFGEGVSAVGALVAVKELD